MSLAERVLEPLPTKRRHKYMLCDPRNIPEVSAESVGRHIPSAGLQANPIPVVYVDGQCLPPYVSRLSDRLFLGNVSAAVSQPLLRGHGITHIVTVMDVPIPEHMRPSDTVILYVDALDVPEAPLHRQFHLASDWIHHTLESSPDTCLMVHCFMGISRSATLILAYWIKYGPVFADLEQAHDMLLELRPIVNPNHGFRRSLEAWWALHRVAPFLHHSLPAPLASFRSCILSYLIGDEDYFQVKQ